MLYFDKLQIENRHIAVIESRNYKYFMQIFIEISQAFCVFALETNYFKIERYNSPFLLFFNGSERQ
jgi:hypothetical protein